LAAVCALVMERNTILVVLGPGQAGTTTQLMHLWLRAWTTVKIGVATNRGEISITTGMISVDLLRELRSAGSEVVVGDRRQR